MSQRPFLPQRGILTCDVCKHDWSAHAHAKGLEWHEDAMVAWATGDDHKRVTSLRIICKGECDRKAGSPSPSLQLSHLAGTAAAWEGAEEMFRTYEWPADLRRKLLAVLREASKLPPRSIP